MLQISRPDITGEYLIDYPVKDRFIKLPVEAYLKLLPVTLPDYSKSNAYDEINRGQVALINAVNSPKYRFICAALSRRLGKTFISNVIGQLVALVPNCDILIMSPNYNLSSISFELQRKFIKQFDLELTKDNIKDRVLELSNGSSIRMGSVNTVDSSVGRSYNLIIFDEAALSEGGDEAFEVSLRPTLDRPNSKAIFISTPRGRKNWFSTFYQRGFDPNHPTWCSILADYHENPRMLDNDVEEARQSMSKDKFEQEYMCNFNVYEGQIYKISEDNVVDEFELQEHHEVIAGLDPGFKDPTAFVVIVYDHKTEEYTLVDEYLESNVVTAKHAEAIQTLLEKWRVETIFIDSAAAQFAADLAYTYDISTMKANKDVLAGIASVQNLVEHGRLKIMRHCRHTLDALDQYQWDTRETLTKEKPAHTNSHIPDAIRYAVHTFTV